MSNSSFINSNLFIILAVLLTISVGDELNEDENNVLGNLFMALGSLLLTKASQIANKQKEDEIKRQIADIENQLQSLKSKLR